MIDKLAATPNANSKSPPAAERRLGPVEYRPIHSVTAYAGNARRHPEKQLAQLMGSIREFGFTIPILVDRNGQIVCGHARVEAAGRLGFREVPTIAATDWSQAQVQAYRLLDNRLGELGEWDEDSLKVELSAIIEIDELPIDVLAWDAAEIDLILGGDDQGDRAGVAKARREPVQPVTRFGDLWLLGKYELPCAPLRYPAQPEHKAKEPYSIAFPASVDAVLRHWILSTGKEPVLADTHETFSEVEARRTGESADRDGSSPINCRN
ncbi:MAG: ParB/Srx family N-terminal domain-containing protein [Sphingomicrobium sp.]